ADVIFVARGVGRPIWIGAGRHERFFASTPQTLELVERYTGVRLRKREVREGTLVALSGGREAWTERFRPDRCFEERQLPAVRASVQSENFGSRPSRRASSTPCSTARSSRSSPTGRSKPASRRAFVSEPKVCQ